MKRTLALFLAGMMLLALCACGSNDAPADTKTPAAPSENTEKPEETAPDFSGREIVFGVWGGSFADACMQAYVEPFEELTGATVTLEEYGADVTVKVIAQKEQGIEGYDVISGCGVLDQMATMADKGALLKLDYSQMPNAEFVDAKYDYCIGQYILSTIIAWNKDVYGDDPPDTMEKYFDLANYPGNRGDCYVGCTGHLEAILLANGVSMDELYPLDVDRAFELYNEINYKDSVTVWWDSAATIRQALSDGEVDCGLFWGGSVIEAIFNDGLDNIGMSHNYASMNTDCLAITAGCKDPELAYAFVNYCLSAEAEAKWAELKFYAPTNPQAYDYIDPEMLPYFTTYGDNAETAFYNDVDFWTEHSEELWNRWLLWIGR